MQNEAASNMSFFEAFLVQRWRSPGEEKKKERKNCETRKMLNSQQRQYTVLKTISS